MKRIITTSMLAGLLAAVALGAGGAGADTGLRAGFGVRAITPAGESSPEWNFWRNPVTDIWSEEFIDQNGNGYYDPGEPHIDDPRNSLIDPQATGEFDGCWTNAGFGGKGPLGVYDDTWARAIVLEADGTKVAIVSLDVVGLFYEEIERVRVELDAEYAGHGIDKVIVSSTHTHEGCDTMGLWGNPGYATDGKFPLYQAFIRSQIVDAIAEANGSLEDARLKAATTIHDAAIRDSRPPHVIDPKLQAAQFLGADDSVIGTIVNWSNHPEALAGNNRHISSDFPHGARERLEEEYGGTAIYFSGSVGGLMTPLRVDMGEPYYDGFNGPDGPLAPEMALLRTYYIGEILADAAIDALATAPVEEPSELTLESREFFMPGDNYSLRALNAAGIFDKPTYTAGVFSGPAGDEFKTEMVSVGLGSVQFQTVPGELFPELEIGGYGRPDCPEADTGRPYEPVIQEQYPDKHLFTLGLAQDELGYIVPGYDFWIAGAPDEVLKAGGVTDESNPRPLLDIGVIEAEDPCGEGHYEETVSASSVMAPIVACIAAELAGNDPWNRTDEDAYAACSEENTTTAPQGLHLDALP
jgi:hypothetical protein